MLSDAIDAITSTLAGPPHRVTMLPSGSERSTDACDAWHRLDAVTVAQRLDVVPAQGLGPAAVRERQAIRGLNRLVEATRRPAWRMLLDQFSDVMVIVLAAAAVVAGVIGEPQDSGKRG